MRIVLLQVVQFRGQVICPTATVSFIYWLCLSALLSTPTDCGASVEQSIIAGDIKSHDSDVTTINL